LTSSIKLMTIFRIYIVKEQIFANIITGSLEPKNETLFVIAYISKFKNKLSLST